MKTFKFIEKAIKLHGGRYQYDKVHYEHSMKKVSISCPLHGVFYQTPNMHLSGRGCPACAIDKQKLTTNDFIKKSINVHKGKYTYEKTLYTTAKNKVIITCPIHGDFPQVASFHIQGSGCYKCNRIERNRLTTEEFIRKANLKHNFYYNYEKTFYKTTKTKLIITCPKHGDFSQIPNDHLTGSGCIKCSSNKSKKEIIWINSFNNSNIIGQHILKIKNKIFIVDGYDPITNSIYEFYGDFWHGNINRYNPEDLNNIIKIKFKELYSKTIKREKILKKAGFNLVTIWESDFDNLFR